MIDAARLGWSVGGGVVPRLGRRLERQKIESEWGHGLKWPNFMGRRNNQPRVVFTMRGVDRSGTSGVERGGGHSTIVWGDDWNDKKKERIFLRIAQFNNNKRLPHNTSTTHNNNQNEPPLPYPQRLRPLIPWACQRRPQCMAPLLPMAPRKVPVIGFGRAMVSSLVGGAK